MRRFVLDTNVLVAALRSRRGASATILSALPLKGWKPVLSVPLYLEYLDVLSRPGMVPPTFTTDDILSLCRYLVSIAHQQDIHYLWRPFLHDPNDDFVLELAVAAGAKQIVTHNARHFQGLEHFGISVLAPRDFLRLVNGSHERRDH